MVARLADGSWSAPSAIATAGAGFGGQIGFELTDFVFILNDYSAVRSFSQAGSITLGGNVSIAAGPIGRNAEAAGAASTKGVAGIFSYSKTKGLFAGVSLEGSVLVERKDANAKLYNSRISASQLLTGAVPSPPGADALMQVLRSRAFSGQMTMNSNDSMYNDIPIYDERHDDVVWDGRRGGAYGENSRNRASSINNEYSDRQPRRTPTWTDDVYDRPTGGLGRSATTRANPHETFDSIGGRGRSATGGLTDDYTYRDRKQGPGRPTAPKPIFAQKTNPASLRKDQAVALYTFTADQDGDLGFKKGEVITILKRTEKKEDWWTGQIGGRTGIFPR